MTKPPSPNVLVVLADQLRRDALGCYGDPDARTPHLDELARSGVRFTRASATSPICVPFRFSLMTGHHAHSRLVPGIEWRMSPAERTLADEARAAGYQTLYIGKWHLYGGHGGAPWSSPREVNRTPVPRVHQGRWEVWRGFELRNAPFDTSYFRDGDPTPIPLEGYQTDALTDLTMATLREARDPARPFFCVLSVEPPHPPYEVPDEYARRWLGRDLTLPPNFQAEGSARDALVRERQLYYAALENLDHNVGRLMGFLDDEGLSEDTTVVFLSDHGELGGSHGLREKQYPFEPSVGIPLLVRDPIIPGRAGTMITEPTCTEDLFPTLLGLIGAPPAGGLPGADLTPLIRGEADSLVRPGVLLEFVAELRPGQPFFEGGWRGVRTARHKYTRLRTPEGSRGWHLFDLEEDPHECHNLLGREEFLPLEREMHALLAELLRAADDDFPIGDL